MSATPQELTARLPELSLGCCPECGSLYAVCSISKKICTTAVAVVVEGGGGTAFLEIWYFNGFCNMHFCLEKWSQAERLWFSVKYVYDNVDTRCSCAATFRPFLTSNVSVKCSFLLFTINVAMANYHYVRCSSTLLIHKWPGEQHDGCNMCLCSVGFPCWAAKQDILLSKACHHTLTPLSPSAPDTRPRPSWKWDHFPCSTSAFHWSF